MPETDIQTFCTAALSSFYLLYRKAWKEQTSVAERFM